MNADDRSMRIRWTDSEEVDQYVLDAITRYNPSLELQPPLLAAQLNLLYEQAECRLKLAGAEIREERIRRQQILEEQYAIGASREPTWAEQQAEKMLFEQQIHDRDF